MNQFLIYIFSLLLFSCTTNKQQMMETSMEGTILKGELVEIEKSSTIERGDIIAFRYKEKVWIFRVIGKSGDKVEIREGKVFINDHKSDLSNRLKFSYKITTKIELSNDYLTNYEGYKININEYLFYLTEKERGI